MKFNLSPDTIYVKIYINKFTAIHIESNSEITKTATKNFTTKRLLVGEFINAEELLKKIKKNLCKINWLSPFPSVIIHPTTMTEGGLSEVEIKVFRELALSAFKARKLVVWVGDELTNEDVLQKIKSA